MWSLDESEKGAYRWICALITGNRLSNQLNIDGGNIVLLAVLYFIGYLFV